VIKKISTTRKASVNFSNFVELSPTDPNIGRLRGKIPTLSPTFPEKPLIRVSWGLFAFVDAKASGHGSPKKMHLTCQGFALYNVGAGDPQIFQLVKVLHWRRL
jgi:hypothetical protein